MMNLANKLTLLRVLLIPFFLICFYLEALSSRTFYFNNYPIAYTNIVALTIFLVAAITDFVDGYIARKYHMITDFGKFMDPLADKLLVTAALLIFIEQGKVAGWIVFIILAREFMVTGLRTVAASKGVVMAAGVSGKVKTVLQFVMIAVYLFNYPFTIMNVQLKPLLVWLVVIVTVASGMEYLLKNLHVLKV